MSDVMDDWFGFDPPPELPEPATPTPPAPTRRVATSNVVTGVDNTRKFSRPTSGGSSVASRNLLVAEDDDDLGVGINV